MYEDLINVELCKKLLSTPEILECNLNEEFVKARFKQIGKKLK